MQEPGPGIHVYVTGRGGRTSDEYLLDTDTPNIAAIDPVMIVHMVGANDWPRDVPPETYKANIVHRLDHLDAAITIPHVHVRALTYPRPDVTSPDYTWAEYGAALREIATDRPDTSPTSTCQRHGTRWASETVTRSGT